MRKLNLKQNTSEWLTERRYRIGASDAPVIMEVSPYKTREQLLHEKVYGSENIMTPAMQYGKDMEGEIIEACSLFCGNEPIFPGGVYVHNERDWQLASIDGVNIDVSRIYEVKANNKKNHEIACSGEVPPLHYPQLQHQIATLEMDGTYYFSYLKGEGKLIWCWRNEEYIKELIKKEWEFYCELSSKRRQIELDGEAVGW